MLRSFDACLLLGNEESFHYSPMKLYEYLASAKPVIATRVGQVGQVLSRTFGEWLVPAGDADGIVDRIERLAGRPAERHSLGSKARDIVLRSASWDVRADALLEALAMRGHVVST
jgi:glycosyltransferase involved in cell wall biosynthesis